MPQCKLRSAHFREINRSTEFLANQQFLGNAFMLLKAAEHLDIWT